MNNSFYSNSEVDRLLGGGARELDPEKRGGIHKTVQQILVEDSLLVWLIEVQYVSVFNRKLHDRTTGPLGTYQAFERTWLEE